MSRFEALWRAWEFLRLEGPTGMAVFFRDYLDTAMPLITASDGPFWRLEKVAGADAARAVGERTTAA